MIFIDSESEQPSFHGTGTEKIFGGGACPNVEYAGPYAGILLISNKDWSGKNGSIANNATIERAIAPSNTC
jgi:hypothetical protein